MSLYLTKQQAAFDLDLGMITMLHTKHLKAIFFSYELQYTLSSENNFANP